MKKIWILIPCLLIETLSFLVAEEIQVMELPNVQQQQSNLGQQIKYSGKGFVVTLQNILKQAISDSSIFYKNKYLTQSDYVRNRLKDAKEGDWNVIIVPGINITKITDVSTGFSYWSDNDTWALWYSATPYSNQTLHVVIYNGKTGKDGVNITTEDSKTKGSNISSTDEQVIRSIIQSLQTVQDMSKYLQKFFNQKWSIISIPAKQGDKDLNIYATISAGQNYICYPGDVKISGRMYSQLLFV